jgi:hypothetical protein
MGAFDQPRPNIGTQLCRAVTGQLVNKEAIQNYQTSISIRAFYIQKNDTIYLNIDDLHEGMLAHEMAHAIIGRYFLVRPPRSTAEILAQYVDKHLFE